MYMYIQNYFKIIPEEPSKGKSTCSVFLNNPGFGYT